MLKLISILALLLTITSAATAQTLSFTQAQVDSGIALYKEVCQVCHGSSMANGQFGTPLRGNFFREKWKGKSLGELVNFVYEKMPPDKLKSLTPEQYTGAVAYILSRNEIAVSDVPMSTDKDSLNNILLPW